MMKQSLIYALPLLGAASARTVNFYNFQKREVPQEHAHRDVNLEINALLALNNPDNIQDAVFGLLGAKAAAEGAGKIADADCLQQAAADQAFTNAKEAGDIAGMTSALVYRALERNSGKVGLASPPCTSIQAVNPEIAALQQHQDPAGDGAQELNKQIASELAFQIASIGGNPADANRASTFAPGDVNDPTAKGNTCDDANDDNGCGNTLGLFVPDLSDAEILAAAQGAGAGAGAGNANAAAANATAEAAAGKGKAKGKAKADGKGKGKAKGKAQEARQAGGAADFGACADPTIVFGIPSDGRKEDAFEASDLANFPHGSALNIGVISSFICDQLVNKCKANQAAVDVCDKADAASKGLKGQAAADAFNQAIGF